MIADRWNMVVVSKPTGTKVIFSAYGSIPKLSGLRIKHLVSSCVWVCWLILLVWESSADNCWTCPYSYCQIADQLVSGGSRVSSFTCMTFAGHCMGWQKHLTFSLITWKASLDLFNEWMHNYTICKRSHPESKNLW